MKTLYIVLLAIVAAGVIALVACSDAVSTDNEVRPLADDEDKVWGIVTKGGDPVNEVWVLLYKREESTDPWIEIGRDQTSNQGYYEIYPALGIWPAGWDGKVDCTNDDITAEKDFSPYLPVGPVRADIELPED
jgi:hypothetical protein